MDKTLKELKEFLNTLSEEQLNQPIRISELDMPVKGISIFDVLQEDHINPSGECAEPISVYLPGGAGHDETDDWDYENEAIVFYKGDVFFHVSE